MAQALSEDQENVEAIEAQIADLQAKRDEALGGYHRGRIEIE